MKELFSACFLPEMLQFCIWHVRLRSQFQVNFFIRWQWLNFSCFIAVILFCQHHLWNISWRYMSCLISVLSILLHCLYTCFYTSIQFFWLVFFRNAAQGELRLHVASKISVLPYSTVMLFIIFKVWKPPICKWINIYVYSSCGVHIYKQNEILFSLKKMIIPFEAKEMKIEDVIPKEVNKAQKERGKLCDFIYIWNLKTAKFIEAESTVVIARKWDMGKMDSCLLKFISSQL